MVFFNFMWFIVKKKKEENNIIIFYCYIVIKYINKGHQSKID